MQTLSDTIRYRHILFALSGRELKAQYRNMSLGFLWALLNPLVMVAVLSTVMSVFLKPEDPYHPSRVVIGLVAYNYFTYCFNGCTSSILNNAPLVRRVRFPRQILPYAVILTNSVHFAVQSTLVVGVLLIFGAPGGPWTWNLLWLPLVVLLQLGLIIGSGMLMAALTVKYRDTRYIVASLVTVLLWASPVLYDAHETFDRAEGGWNWIHCAYFANPLAGILDGYRRILFWGEAPDPVITGVTVLITAAIGFVGMRTFWSLEREFAELCR